MRSTAFPSRLVFRVDLSVDLAELVKPLSIMVAVEVPFRDSLTQWSECPHDLGSQAPLIVLISTTVRAPPSVVGTANEAIPLSAT